MTNTCSNCNEEYGDLPSCPTCTIQKMEDEGHYGWYDLTKGWTCYASCPACETERAKQTKQTKGPDLDESIQVCVLSLEHLRDEAYSLAGALDCVLTNIIDVIKALAGKEDLCE